MHERNLALRVANKELKMGSGPEAVAAVEKWTLELVTNLDFSEDKVVVADWPWSNSAVVELGDSIPIRKGV
ncbi:hypothetical protein B296_00002970 [Ensete ventricosum]|uniref:Uncharacterized protein n=1 Tax=Ensete ventricosum TaxID=4639 RepID=A0A427BAS9_ENSVE|nr:hypothetical protein B296_00002970 [Ensete ventricosum]